MFIKDTDVTARQFEYIAKTYGTPVYVYNANSIRNSYSNLQNSLTKNVDIFYSIKANPNIEVCRILKTEGAGAEVCTSAELEFALHAGFSPLDIIFVGPYKTDKDLLNCIELKIFAIVCESIEEYERIHQFASRCGKVANVVIRINPNFVSDHALLKMGGKPSQFGIDWDIVLANQNAFLNKSHINLMGVHVYCGTRILDPHAIYEHTRLIFELVSTLEKLWNKSFSTVDIGGGVGVAYFNNEKSFDLALFQQLMSPLVAQFKKSHPTVRIIMESGRYLVGQSGTFVSRIHCIKESKGELFIITDGGTNCHMAAVGIGSFVHRNFPIYLINEKEDKGESITCHITGPLCTPGDLIGKNVSLPSVQVGDLIGIRSSGAYGLTASPVLFLSHGSPAECLVDGEEIYLIRNRDSVTDLLSKQVFSNENRSNKLCVNQ